MCSLRYTAAGKGGQVEWVQELRRLQNIGFLAPFVAKAAFTMETDVGVHNLQSAGMESTLLQQEE